jgi:hypothetical protein
MLIRQRLAVLVPRVHQRRDQVVGRIFLAMLDVAGEIAGHLPHRLHQRVVILDAEFEDAVDPLDEEIAVLLGNPEHVRDGADRNMLGARGVAFAVSNELVDQFVAMARTPARASSSRPA